jgi:hypothetical protein
MNVAGFIVLACVFCVAWVLVKSEWKGDFKDYEDDKEQDEHSKPENWGAK